MMEGMLAKIAFWHWWVVGVVLLITEALVPGYIFLWMGVAAGFVGLILLIWPDMTWHYQILAFSVLSVLSIVAFKVYVKGRPTTTDQPHLNRRGEQYIGRTLTLDKPIINGVGEVRVDDTVWRVLGPELSADARIRVIGVDGNSLRVEDAKD